MSKMFVSTLSLLVLTSSVVTFVVNNEHSASRARNGIATCIGDSEKGENYVGTGENYVGTFNENDHRRRRAVTSFNAAFLKAWKAILKTTIGSTFGINEKAFIKVGTLDDAMKDFISFRPKGIFQNARPGSLQGYVGNQIIKIETGVEHEPVITMLYRAPANGGPTPYQKHRSIYYFKNQEEAEDHLRAWKSYGLGP